MKSGELSKIMKRAWVIFRETGKQFAICLAKSWQLYRLARSMRAGVVRFAFEKADGSMRKALGTLKDIRCLIKGTGVDTPSTFRYFDVEANGFRCFRVTNLIAIY